MKPDKDFEAFLSDYITAALWSSTDDNGDPLDANRDESDVAAETLEKMRADCWAFYSKHRDSLSVMMERGGHDFWLTRNGHGAGFWDGDWPSPQDQILTDACKEFGQIDLYIGDDGLIYSM